MKSLNALALLVLSGNQNLVPLNALRIVELAVVAVLSFGHSFFARVWGHL